MKVRASKYISPSAALENLNPPQLLQKLQKLHVIPKNSVQIN